MPDPADLLVDVGTGEPPTDPVTGDVLIGDAPAAAKPTAADEDSEFYENLALRLDDAFLNKLGPQIVEEVERDIASRQEWEEMYAQGMRTLGFDRNDDEASDRFPGASNVVHPLIPQACTDFQSRAGKELMPPNGPVRTRVWGDQTPDKLAIAERKREHMNYQLTVEMPEARDETDSMLFELPLVGSTFKVLGWDHAADRPFDKFVLPEDFVVPYGATDLERTRYTQILRLEKADLDGMMGPDGLYRQVDITPSSDDDTSAAKRQSDEISGSKSSGDPADERIVLYQVDRFDTLPDEIDGDECVPYAVTVDKASGKVLSIYRRWREEDEKRLRTRRVTHYKFGARRGFYGWGLVHAIGGLAKGATGALRALLDSAMVETVPGGIRLKGARPTTNDNMFRPFSYAEIDPGPAPDPDIRKLAMPYPTKGPSPVLFQLLGFLVEAGQNFASVTASAMQDASNTGPVGTTLALIEQGAQVYAAIHARLWAAQARELQILADLNYEYLDDEVTAKTFKGEMIVYRQDYADNLDIVPVSDPNIFSDAQRLAQDQALLQLIETPGMRGLNWDKQELAERILTTMRIPHPEKLLPPPKQAQPLDPVSEMLALVRGMPVQAFPGQDHMAHIQFLMGVVHDPLYQPMMPAIGPRLQALVSEHMVANMRTEVEHMIGQPLPPPGPPLPPPVAAAMAQAMSRVEGMMAQGRIAQAQQAAAAQRPGGAPPGQDPMLQGKVMLEQQRARDDAAADARDAAAQQQNDDRAAQLAAARFAHDQQTQAQEDQRENLRAQADLVAEDKDRQLDAARIAADLRAAEIEAEAKKANAVTQAQAEIITTAMKLTGQPDVPGPIGATDVETPQ